jgi:membrane-associated protein
MDITNPIDFILHIDHYLEILLTQYQTTTYVILCLIIFCETGLVATPFLPGDSLLFAAGALIAKVGVLNVWVLIPLLFLSAILGDNVNYFVGKYIGHKIFEMKYIRQFIKKEYLDRTHQFYEKHGGRTIVMARFVPIIRTFAPFVAGLGEMEYKKYITYCVIGGIIWVSSLTLAGYYFGGIDVIKNNFELVVFAIILISLIPAVIQIVKARSDIKKAKNAA